MTDNDQTTQENTVKFTLTLQEVNVILGALNEAPFKVADPLLKKIVPQAQQQLEALKAEKQQ